MLAQSASKMSSTDAAKKLTPSRKIFTFLNKLGGFVTVIRAKNEETLKCGIFYDMPDAEYRAIKAISYSGLKSLAISPAHYLASRSKEQKDTPAMRLGRLIHLAVLEPAKFEAVTRVAELNLRTKADREARDSMKADGVEILSHDEYAQIIGVKKAVFSHAIAGNIFNGGFSEVSLLWVDEESGALCKARLDKYQKHIHIVGDLKTTESASEFGVKSSLTSFQYHLQAAFYLAGIKALTGIDHEFIFAFVEKEAPHGIRVGRLARSVVMHAEHVIKPLLKIYKECVTKNVWPGYPQELEEFELTGWAMREIQFHQQ